MFQKGIWEEANLLKCGLWEYFGKVHNACLHILKTHVSVKKCLLSVSEISSEMNYKDTINNTLYLSWVNTFFILWWLWRNKTVLFGFQADVTNYHKLDGFNSVQSLSRAWLFASPWTAACQASLSIINSRNSPKFMSIELVMPSKHLIVHHPLLLPPPIFPRTGRFPISQFFISGSQSIGASTSTSVLPANIQDWFPLEFTGWIYLQFKGLSRVFSNTTVQKHQFFGAQVSSQSNSHIHTWLLEK